MSLIGLHDVSFRYPQRAEDALRDVWLEVEAGEFLLLCGRSGCGKTTLLRLLKQPLAPHGQLQGRVLFEGRPLARVPLREQAARIGFVMQDPDAQIVTDKVWHELAFGLENLGVPRPQMRSRVAEMASYFGIQGWFDRDVAELSGGQKQLLNLASVMAMAPDVLVLDEPTSQLDPIAAADYLATVAKLNRELGTTVIMAEHRLEEAFSLADRVVVLEAGAIAAQGTPCTVARQLHDAESPMAAVLPTPARVAFMVEDADNDERLPLTVREGREWLKRRLEVQPPERRYVQDCPVSATGERACSPNGPSEEAGGGKRASGPWALQLKELWFRYERDGADVLRGASLAVPEGGLYALVGGNGVGKSTLLRAICGAVKPYRGSGQALGQPLKSWQKPQGGAGGVALLPQDLLSIMAADTVRADLEEMLRAMAVPPQRWHEELARVVGLCQLEGLLEAHPCDISGGELQRAALAKVLLRRPRLLLLDEPTKGLDAFFKRQLGQALRQLAAEGVTVLLVSHDVEFCAQWATEVALMFNGEVVSAGTPRTLFGSNSFYTTAASRMSRGLLEGAVTAEDIAGTCAPA